MLAIATLLGSISALSIAESFKSEESKVELTELVEFELDGEEKLVENRRRQIRRRSIVSRRQDTGQLHKRSISDVAELPPPLRHKHNGCGSHLRV